MPQNSKRIRGVWAKFAAIAVLIFIFRLVQFDGWLRPVVVAGPSMAPRLWGPSIKLTCSSCGLSVRAVCTTDEIQGHETQGQWTCSNCGFPQPVRDARMVSADRVLIDRVAYWFRHPRRNELVVVNPLGGQPRVKRVVGLPGESLSIRDGDLWIDGSRWQKTLEESHQFGSLVYDDRFRSEKGPPRWRPFSCEDSPITLVPESKNAYQFPPAGHACYLRYGHYSPYGVRTEWQSSPVLNDNPINLQMSQRLYRATDLRVVGTIHAEASVRMITGIWTPSGVRSSEVNLPSRKLVGFEFAWLDGQAWIALDGTERCVSPAESIAERFDSNWLCAEHPVLIGCESNGAVTISEMQIFQDTYLIGPPGAERDWSGTPLAEDHVFLLGDNIAASLDDRRQTLGTPIGRISGRVD